MIFNRISKEKEKANDANLLIYSYANKKYYEFAILYPIWVLQNNQDAKIEIALEDKDLFYKKYSHLIEYYEKNYTNKVLFTQIDKKVIQYPAGTIRFITQPKSKAKYVYIGDIDIIVLHNICTLHIPNIEKNALDFSNIKRIGQNKLSGLHFIEYEKMYPVEKIKKKLKHINDEELLYILMKNKGYKIPDENKNKYRPLCGIHISYFSRPPLKTLTTKDEETTFPSWYDNCNNEKLLYSEIENFFNLRYSEKIKNFYNNIKETDIDLRRIIQFIDLFAFYLKNNQQLLS